MKYVFGLLLFSLANYQSLSQCPTSGNIASNCTTSGNLTITSNTLTAQSGVTVTVTGTLTIRGGSTLNATGATFNLGGLSETYGSLNTISGGTYQTASFQTGGGGNFTLSNAQIQLNSATNIAIAGSNVQISGTTFTNVANWTTNVNAISLSETNISASGNIQLEDVTVSNSTFNASGSFSTANGSNSLSNSNVNAGTSVSLRNTQFSDGSMDAGGTLSIQSGNVSISNSTVRSGFNNAGTNDAVALNMNGGGVLTLLNNTQMSVRGSVINNEWYIDNSDVVITGDFDNAGSEILEVRNGGTIQVQGDFDNSGSGNVSADDGGSVQVDGDYNNSGGGSTDVDGGTVIVGGSYAGDEPTGDTGTCSGGSGGCSGSNCSTLPIVLAEFNVKIENNQVIINWVTAQEISNDYFTITRSMDGIMFDEIARISGAGTTGTPQQYSYVDPFPLNQKAFYQLTQTDYDGTSESFEIVLIESTSTFESPKVFPNPIQQGNAFSVTNLAFGASWELRNLRGQLLLRGKSEPGQAISTGNLSKGTYLLKFPDSPQNPLKVLIQ
ncbi:MAG: T9SS type A sorting domain-containing protein [Cytophagales bacterium]|nr:T9SS type A sorting domain-containing protein [Cytophagales bacterium]